MFTLPPDNAYPPTNLLMYRKQFIRLVHGVIRKASQTLAGGNAETRFCSCHYSAQYSPGSTQ